MSSKMRHCQTCGYEEPSPDLLVCCSQCEEIMVHRYCMDGPLRYGDEEVVWLCDDCSPRFVKHLIVGQHVEDSNEVPQLERKMLDATSEDLGLKCQRGSISSLEHGFDTMKNQNHEKDIMLDTKPKSSLLNHPHDPHDRPEPSPPKLLSNSLGCPHSPPKIERIDGRCISIFDQPIDHGPCNSEMVANRNGVSNNKLGVKNSCGAFVHKGDVKRLVDNSQPVLPLLKRFPSLPRNDTSWRGTCRVTHEMYYRVSFKLKAHLSVTASSNVAKAVQTLPMPLDLELVHKSNNWPKRFNESHPSGEDISLYFFPMQESDVKHCAALLEKMFDDDLVLKFSRNDLNLLLFTSFDLPKEIMSFNGKCYLWGVFSSPRSSSFTNVTPTSHLMEQNPQIIKLASQNVCSANFGKCSHEREDKRQCIPICAHALPMSLPSSIKKCKPCGTTSSQLSTGSIDHQQVIGCQPMHIVYALPTISPFSQTKNKSSHNADKEKRIQISNGKFPPRKVKLDVHAQVRKQNKCLSHKMHPMKRSSKSQARWDRWVESNLNPRPNASLPPLPNRARFAKSKKRNQTYYNEESNLNPRPNASLPPLPNHAKSALSKKRSQT